MGWLRNRIDKKNGVDKLSDCLRGKLAAYDKSRVGKANEYFSWEEFKEVFCTVTCQWMFTYGENHLVLENMGKLVGFVNEGVGEYEKYSSPQELLENVIVDGKSLEEIWGELE